jgi:Double zinc ribbon
MHCPNYGFENLEGLKFCHDCGTPLRMPCAQCGFMNQPQAKFCGECGPLFPREPQPRRPTSGPAPSCTSELHPWLPWPRRFCPRRVLWRASASKSPSSSPTLKAPWRCLPTETRRRLGTCSTRYWKACWQPSIAATGRSTKSWAAASWPCSGRRWNMKTMRPPGLGAIAGSVAHFDFRGKIRKSGIKNSMAYRLQNARKSKFATESSQLRLPCDLFPPLDSRSVDQALILPLAQPWSPREHIHARASAGQVRPHPVRPSPVPATDPAPRRPNSRVRPKAESSPR